MSERFDPVVVGAGFGGLTTALSAAARGMRPVVLERSELVGGACAFSGGQVWVPGNHVAAREGIEDSVEAGVEYVAATATEYPELRNEERTREWLGSARLAAAELEREAGFRWDVIPGYPDYYHPDAPGSLEAGRYLTSAPSLLAELGAEARRLRRSPHFPSGPTYGEMLDWGGMAHRSAWDVELMVARRRAGVLMFGEGIAAQAYRAVLRKSIDVRFAHRVRELVLDGGVVVGAVAETGSGTVSFSGRVVLASSTFDWNPELVSRFFGVPAESLGSLAPTVLTGDAVGLVESAGGEVRAYPRHLAPMLPGYRVAETDELEPGYRTCFEHCLPHAIIVDERGERFCDDSFYRAITRGVLGENGPIRRFFLIWDEQHHRRYGLGPTPPGGDYPHAVVAASDPASLGRALGIDGGGLARTVESFNGPARAGADPVFGRGTNHAVRRFRGDSTHEPNSLLGPVEEPPFFGLELVLVGTGIGMAGAVTGACGRVVAQDGGTVEGLYAIGPAAAPVHAGSSYNSGYTLSRSMTYGYLAAVDIAERRATA